MDSWIPFIQGSEKVSQQGIFYETNECIIIIELYGDEWNFITLLLFFSGTIHIW